MSEYRPDPKFLGRSTPEDSRAVGKYLLFFFALLAAAAVVVFSLICLFKKTPRAASVHPPAQPAFYFWKTRFAPSETERATLNSLSVKKLYLKFFDVDLEETNGQAAPTAILELDSTWLTRSVLSEKQLIGCVFLTNRVFENESLEPDFLAKKCLSLIEKLVEKLPVGQVVELQFDCDWTASTRDRFFLFLKKIEAQKPSGLQISATIRLHQLRFFEKTGVPPVERGMLMCYNTGDLDDEATENSILDTATAKNYLARLKKYPLPLDVALPIFRWGVVFRDGQFFKLINGLDSMRLADKNLFDCKTANLFYENTEKQFYKNTEKSFYRKTANWFSVKKATFLEGHFLHEGDEIRLESPTPAALEWAAKQTARLGGDAPRTIAFFQLDSSTARDFPPIFLEKLIRLAN